VSTPPDARAAGEIRPDRSPASTTTAAGLSTEDARRRSAVQGPNRLPKPPRPSLLAQLLRQLTHLLALLLWVAAALAVLAGLPELAVAIIVVVLLNAGFAFAQEYRADRSAERLDAMLPSRVLVRRDGRLHSVESVELVCGDVVVLSAGDRLAADLLLLTAHDVKVDESLVTGESRAVSRGDGDTVLAGTFVVQGEGLAEVAAIGADTTIAGISALTRHRMANAFACRSETVPAWRVPPGTNRLVLAAVAAEAVLLVAFVGLPWLARLLGGSWPPPAGWAMAATSAVLLLLVDAFHKHRRRRRLR
jgi:magnesium-transporting ATPase (P-type)